MNGYSSNTDKETITRLSRPCPYPEWLLLELPDGRFAAFWAQGFELEHATAVAQGDYRGGCSYINKNKEFVLAHMARHRLSLHPTLDDDDIAEACTIAVDLDEDEAAAILKAYDCGLDKLNDDQRQALTIVIAKLKDQIWQ